MEQIVLGRTGLKATVAGLGCGGHSRLGRATGRTEQESIAVVKRAVDLGVNFIDTARVYGTEEIVGKAIAGRREDLIISTKAPPVSREGDSDSAHLRASLERSLQALGTDYVDVFHLHGVAESQYDHCVAELVPEMFRLRDAGKIRFLAVSEQFGRDTGHHMLIRAIRDDYWDVMMVGFNLLNPSARDRVFPLTIQKEIGVLIMFAVRRLLASPEELKKAIAELVDQGLVSGKDLDLSNPLGFLEDESSSVIDAAYRFVRHEPGVHVTLTGTGNVDHLTENLNSISKGPLSEIQLERLRKLFGKLDNLSGN